MKIDINNSGIDNNAIDKALLEEIAKQLKVNDKVEYSDKIPTNEDIIIWINPEDDLQQEFLIRINDETVASNTVWSSEKVNNIINEMFIQADSHIHINKDALDLITVNDIDKWNNKSDFDGSYKSLTNKPYIPSIEGLASETYVDEAIENLQLPPNLAVKEDIPTKVSELENDNNFVTSDDLHEHSNKIVIDGITSEQVAKWDSNTSFDGDYYSLKNKPNIPTYTSELQNDSGFISEIPSEYITETELENKGYLTEHQDISNLATKEELFNKDYNDLINKPNIPSIEGLASEEYVDSAIENIPKIDLSEYATKEELHEHENKNILDSITEEKINSWNNKSSFDGNYNNLTNKPNIPTYTSELQNDSGFISEIPSEYITETELENTINNMEKTVSSNIQPVDNNVTLWVNTSEDEATTVTRINDETVASNTTWSSEKVNTLISSLKLIKEGNVVKLMLGDIELSNINI